DVAGMGADLFESYAGSIIAPVALTAFSLSLIADSDIGDGALSLLFFPMFIAFVGMIGSIIGSFMVKGGTSTDSHALSKALHMGTNVAMGITVIGTLIGAYWMFGDSTYFENPLGLAIAVIGGLLIGWALGKTAEYYTSDQFGPVKQIAEQTETGPA
ncbi:MAG: sodium/proton-translocating pyrophosphatase, partial [Acidimicrobiales bacterium]